MKKIFIVMMAAAISAVTFFSGCSENTNYKDGTYEGKSEIHTAGEEEGEESGGSGYGVVKLTVKDNKITACEYQTFEEDGTLKDEEYGKQNGEIANADFYSKAQKAQKACPIYASELVEAGNIEQVDVISGATINYEEFKEAVYDALDKAAE